MNKQRFLFIAPSIFRLILIVVLASSQITIAKPAAQRAIDLSSEATILDAYGQLPLSFEANKGQTDDQVKFLSRGGGYNLFLTATEAVLTLRQTDEPQHMAERAPEGGGLKESQPSKYAVLHLQLVGANPAPKLMGLEQLRGKVNYFFGNDPDEWHTDIPIYGKVAYQDVYPGVDLIYYGKQGQLEYDFIVSPGANPANIVLGLAGANSLAIDSQGDLVLRTRSGEVRQQRPVVYQELDGVRQEVASRYKLTDQNQIYIEVNTYDASRSLVIDPVLVYSTFLGGSDNDEGNGIAVDNAGNAYVTGETFSTNFPTTSGAFDTTFNVGTDMAFVTKLNPAGSGLVYSTFLGGIDGAVGEGIAVDSAGNAYVTGITSGNFPTTSGAFRTTSVFDSLLGGSDGFVTKLNSAGSALVYSTYLGGGPVTGIGPTNAGYGIAVDSTRNAYVTGETRSSDFPTTAGAFDTTFNSGTYEAFVTKLNPSGSDLVYSTYLGGSLQDTSQGRDIVVDSLGRAYVTGMTSSSNFPTTPGAFDTTLTGDFSAFVTKLNPSGSALIYSTYLGGSKFDYGNAIAVNSAGNAYVIGNATSSDFPTTPGAFDITLNTSFDAFVAKLNPTGSALVYSTYLGGNGVDRGWFGAVDSAGNVYVTGSTTSSNFPITFGALDIVYNGGVEDAFVTKLNPAGSALVYSTYIGGIERDEGQGLAVDSTGNAYITGVTDSADFPATSGAFGPTLNSILDDAFVAKLNMVPVPVPTGLALTLTPAVSISRAGTMHCVTATVTDAGGTLVPNIIVRIRVIGTIFRNHLGLTNSSGKVRFCYFGLARRLGRDTITAYVDIDNDNTRDSGEPVDTARKFWFPY